MPGCKGPRSRGWCGSILLQGLLLTILPAIRAFSVVNPPHVLRGRAAVGCCWGPKNRLVKEGEQRIAEDSRSRHFSLRFVGRLGKSAPGGSLTDQAALTRLVSAGVHPTRLYTRAGRKRSALAHTTGEK